MAKGIIVVDVSESCNQCSFMLEDVQGACCMCESEPDNEGYYREIPIQDIGHRRPDWCPIRLIPEKRVGYREEIPFMCGFNACIGELLKEERDG